MSTVENFARFINQCRECKEASNYKEFLKFKLLSHFLTGVAFNWYLNLTPNSISCWNDLQIQIRIHFAKMDPGVNLSDRARIQQSHGEAINEYRPISKRSKVRCNKNILGKDFVQMVQYSLDIPFRKKLDGVPLTDFALLVEIASRYERTFVIRKQLQHQSYAKGQDEFDFKYATHIVVVKYIEGAPYQQPRLQKEKFVTASRGESLVYNLD